MGKVLHTPTNKVPTTVPGASSALQAEILQEFDALYDGNSNINTDQHVNSTQDQIMNHNANSSTNDEMEKGKTPSEPNSQSKNKCILCDMKNDRWMVCCDVCEQWYHYRCVGVNDSVKDSEFVCERCKKDSTTAKTTDDITNKTPSKCDGPEITHKTISSSPSTGRGKSHSSKRSCQAQLAIIEEERQLLLKAADAERRIEMEYARKCQIAEQGLINKKLELLDKMGSDTGSTIDRSSMTSRWINSHGKSLVFTNQNKINELTEIKLNYNDKVQEFTTPAMIEDENVNQFEKYECISKPKQCDQIGQNTALCHRLDPTLKTAYKYDDDKKVSFPKDLCSANHTLNSSHAQQVSNVEQGGCKPKDQVAISTQADGLLSKQHIQARFAVGKNDLPDFSGDPCEWPLFITTYERTTKRCGYSNEDNLERLLKALKGEARKKVLGRLKNPNTVPSIIDTLRRRYGNPTKIVDQLIAAVGKIPAIKFNDPSGLENLSTTVEDLVETIESAELHSELQNRSLIRDIILKLPFDYQMKWTEYSKTLSQSNLNVNLSTLNQWLLNIADTVGLLPSDRKIDSSEKKGNNRNEKRFVHRVAAHDIKTDKPPESSADDNTGRGEYTCPACSATNHKINDCQTFIQMGKNDRWQFVTNKRLCRSCLALHHTKYCKKKKSCGIDGCDRIHNPLLHTPKRSTEGTATDSTSNRNQPIVESANHHLHHADSSRAILYRILPVRLSGKTKEIKTFAFMDEGSSTTLLEKSIADELELVGPETDICMKWTSDVKRIQKSSKKVNLQIAAENSTKSYSLANVRTVDSLNLPTQTVDESSINHPHLKGLPITKFNMGKPTILIGMDNYKLCVPLKVREGKDNEPVATKSRLGWLLAGSIKQDAGIRINVHEVEEPEQDLHSLVKDFFSVENMGVTPGINTVQSEDNIRALEVLKTTTKLSDDRYETGLIWKFPKVSLPESRGMAERRMLCLEKKLARDEALQENVKKQIGEYIQKGYARKLSVEEAAVTMPHTWYLPIFTVRNPNKPAKVRLVWDAAARSNGVALNDMLLKGPDMLNPLQGVLMRFREKPVAVGGDLEQMFHKVKIIARDQHSQRFLWRNDPKQPPDVYIMQVMTFGATCSPTSAQYVLHENSNRFSEKSPRAVMAIQRNHYVDDWLDSFGTIEEAKQVAKDVQQIHEAGGFTIHNWVTNSIEVLDAVKQDSAKQKNLSNLNDSPVERVLGMHWRTADDKFIFVINRNRLNMNIIDGDQIPTKRQVLSTVMSTFDPLGLIASYVIYAKTLLQDIWRTSVDWDDPIKDEQYQKWKLWTSQFKSIERLEIPRCYSKLWSEKDTTYEIHIFVDASETAYAAAAYICSTTNNYRECSLIASKTRVAPNKPTSIPRLELLSAVLGARLLKTIVANQSIEFSKRYLWTDSRTVLSWLNSDARKYRQFVALRIAEILDITVQADWRWVPSQSNVADEATKWSSNQKFTDDSRWYNGPKFLLAPKEEWPRIEKINASTTEEEIRPIYVHTAEPLPLPTTPNENNFSSWERLRRTTAALPRMARLLKSKIQKTTLNESDNFSSDNTKQAEIHLFMKAQQLAYSDEIHLLKQGKAVGKTSNIFIYSPYIDDDGLIRMRGRIDNAPGIMHDTKRPVILPHDSRISFLYVDYYHRKYLHRNHDTVLNEVRQRVVIPKLRSLLNKVRRSCQKCKNDAAKAVPPEMGQLPPSRLQVHCRPFSYIGVDYFGPIEVIDGRKVLKRYGVLFTCMTSRGIHLEMSYSLSSDFCIMALERFISRKGTPLQITSDNATNFRGASKELSDMIRDISPTKLTKTFPEISWIFIPPSSPHFGGAWERLIRIVKSNLMEVVKVKRPTDEMLVTYFAQVENIVNSRPLTEVPIEDESAEAITPNHLIHGTSSGVKPFFNLKLEDGLYIRQWLTVEQMCNSFWTRFVKEVVPTLTKRTKWFKPAQPISVGDVVIIVDEKTPRNTWQKGVIVDVNHGKDGQTRSAVIRTQTGLYTKPTVKLAVLDVKSKQPQPEASPLTGGDC